MAAAALLAAAVVLAATHLGVGATPDTGHYLATADNVLAGRGFVRMGPEIMASWPPLFPALLALVGLVGLDMLVAARLINVVALACTAAIAVYWVATVTRSIAFGLAAGVAIAVGPPLVYSGTLALTDAPFVILKILSLWLTASWVDSQRRGTLAAAIACIALACLMRYNGVLLIATAVMAALALSPASLTRRLRDAALIAVAGSLPLSLWFARNVWLTGTVAGPRVPSDYRVPDALADAGYTVIAWFAPYRVLLVHRLAGALLLAGLFVVLLAVAWRARRAAAGRAALVCLIFVGLFVPFMVFTFTRVAVDPLADRMMAPAYVPLVIATLCAAALLWQGGASAARQTTLAMLRYAIPVALLVVLAVAAARTRGIVLESWHEGPGGSAHSNFNTPAWRGSPSLHWTASNLRGELIFASAPAALYIATRADARPMPRKHARRSPGIPHDNLDELREEVARAGEAYLLVTDGHVPSHTFSLDELSTAFVISEVRDFDDGTVYRLLPRL